LCDAGFAGATNRYLAPPLVMDTGVPSGATNGGKILADGSIEIARWDL